MLDILSVSHIVFLCHSCYPTCWFLSCAENPTFIGMKGRKKNSGSKLLKFLPLRLVLWLSVNFDFPGCGPFHTVSITWFN